MNAKTLEAITRHGKNLLAIFPESTEKDPVTLCKKLRRVEVATSRVMTDYCNGDATENEADLAAEKAKIRVAAILGLTVPQLKERGFLVNRDPRGYSCKIDDEKMREGKLELHRDWGGYGILAPEISE